MARATAHVTFEYNPEDFKLPDSKQDIVPYLEDELFSYGGCSALLKVDTIGVELDDDE